MSVSGSDVSFKSIDGLGPNTKGGGGGGSGAPTNVAYILLTGAGAAALTAYRILIAGASLVYTDGGALGNLTFDIAKSIWTGSKASTPVAKQGIIDVPTVSPSTYTGLAATNNSALSMGGNDFSGVASGVIIGGGDQTGNAGDRNSINNVINCIIAGITHILSGGLAGSIIAGYNNVVTGGGNQIIGGQANTIVSSGAVLTCGIVCSATSTQTALLCGENNGITGGRNNSILSGKLNTITTGNQCCISGYNNGITGGNDTLISGYACSFNGGVTNDVNQLIGYGISLIGGLNHRGNLWLVGGFGSAAGRAATTYASSMLMAIGTPTAASAFDNGGVVAPPVGYHANNTLALYGDRIVMDCNNAGEMRCIGVNNIRSANAPATGDDYCNKTYVDSRVGYTTTTNVQQIDGPWFNNFTIHCELLSPTIVTLSWQDLTAGCTLNAVFTGIFNPLPVQFRPISDKMFHIRVQDDGVTNVSGSLRIQTTGYIVIGVNRTDTNANHLTMEQIFHDSGTGSVCGILAGCVTYSTVH